MGRQEAQALFLGRVDLTQRDSGCVTRAAVAPRLSDAKDVEGFGRLCGDGHRQQQGLLVLLGDRRALLRRAAGVLHRARHRYLRVLGRSQGGGAKGDAGGLVPITPGLHMRLDRPLAQTGSTRVRSAPIRIRIELGGGRGI